MKIKGLWRVKRLFSSSKKCLSKIINKFYNQAVILAYHRVATLDTDPQLLSVNPDNFAQQLEILKKHYNVVSLEELHTSLQKKSLQHKTVALTFDDGYVDNFLYAKPLLEHYKIPATIFVTTGYIEKKQELWWDELEHLLLKETLPQHLSITIDNHVHKWNLKNDSLKREDVKQWNARMSPQIHNRFAFYKDLHRLLAPLHHEKQKKILQEIREWAGLKNRVREDYRVVNKHEIKELAKSPYVTIGAHTTTHPILSKQTSETQVYEIKKSKQDLEKIIGSPVTCFSYPFGSMQDIGPLAPTIVRNTGYNIAVANYPETVTHKKNIYTLPRFLVHNWNKKTFALHMKKWFNE